MDNITKVETIELNFFAIRSKNGIWHGTGRNRESTDISKAKIYNTAGKAKAQLTKWVQANPNELIPDLVRITTGQCEYIQQGERVMEALRVISLRKLEAKRDCLIRCINNYITSNNVDMQRVAQWKRDLVELTDKISKIKTPV